MLRTVALASAPAVIAFVTLRLAIPTVGREQIPGYGGSLLGGRIDVLEEALEEPGTQLRRLFAIYGPLWFVAPFALAGMRFARRGTIVVALCALACTFALDWGRILFIAAPDRLRRVGLGPRPPSRRGARRSSRSSPRSSSATRSYMQVDGVENLIEAGPPPYPVR